MSSSHLHELAAGISQNVALLVAELQTSGLVQPAFTETSLEKYPEVKSIQEPRQKLIELAMDLYHLALGHGEYIKQQVFLLNHDRTTLEVLSHFDVYQAVPLERSATYEEIAERTKMLVSIAKRYLRHAFTMRIFKEEDGQVIHTAASAYAASSQHLKAWVGHCTEDITPASIQEVKTIEEGDINDVSTCVWLRAFDPGHVKGYRSMFEHIATEGDATIVDVGGSTGHLSFELASRHPGLKMIVQDFAGLEDQFLVAGPLKLANRVSFQAHDFFEEQPVQNAHYMFKHSLHDWPDKYNIDIIHKTVSSMGPSSKIFVVDSVWLKHGVLPYFLERFMTALDLQMELASRAKERSADEWAKLFEDADPSLVLNSITQPPDCAYAVMEVSKKPA